MLALAAPGLLRGPQAAAPLGAVAAVLADDLAELTMLGDTGAHALGAAVGTAVATGHGRLGLAVHAAGLVAAAVCGDRVSALARSPMWVNPAGELRRSARQRSHFGAGTCVPAGILGA